jgi:hypothetical protein
MPPFGAEIPTLASSQPASMVSATGSGTANLPEARNTPNPSAKPAPAPPSSSGTHASVRPASSNAFQAGAFQPSSRARLIVCGSARSEKIRVAVSTTGLILSMPHLLVSERDHYLLMDLGI